MQPITNSYMNSLFTASMNRPYKLIPFDRTLQPGFFYKSLRIQRNLQAIDQFIWNNSLNFLLIFGPSGSGKTSILTHYLNSKRLQGSWQQGEQYGEGPSDTLRKVRLPEIILRVCSSSSARQLHIFSDFPTSNSEFSKVCRFAFAGCQAKVVFLLNSTIFNKRLIEGHFKTFEGEELGNTLSIEIKQFSVPELKKIGEEFRKRNGFDGGNKMHLEELAELSHGDARRMLNNVWMDLMHLQKAVKAGEDSNNSSQADRTTIFHFMGKLLYNKRICPDLFIFEEEGESSKTSSKKAFQKQNNIRQMSYQQLKLYDPPFYFNPVDLLRNSCLDCKLIQMLLQENYLDFYFNMHDISKMSSLFSQLDSLQNPKRSTIITKQQVDDLQTFLLSWGIMLYNLHCSQGGKSRFRSFRKSGIAVYQKQLKAKKAALKAVSRFRRTFEMLECAVYHPYVCSQLMMLGEMFVIRRRSHGDGSVEENDIVLYQGEENGAGKKSRNGRIVVRRAKFVPPDDPDFDDIDPES